MNNNLFAVTNIVASFSEIVVIKLTADVIINVIKLRAKLLNVVICFFILMIIKEKMYSIYKGK